MESALQRMARENINPRVIEAFFEKAAKKENSLAPVPLFKFLDVRFHISLDLVQLLLFFNYVGYLLSISFQVNLAGDLCS